jgi:signal peptidase I
MRKRKIGIPNKEQLKRELKREQKKVRRREMLFGTVESLIVAAAVAVLAAGRLAPVLQIDGSSMEPLLYDGEMVVSFRKHDFKRGDIVAFHHNNKVLIKRIVALEGEIIDIDENGNVSIDDAQLDEDYLKDNKPAFGKCNIVLPCKVPEGSVFVMGDNREVSVDSRSIDIGCVSKEQMISKVAFRIWPMKSFGPID